MEMMKGEKNYDDNNTVEESGFYSTHTVLIVLT